MSARPATLFKSVLVNPPPADLTERAARNYPDSQYLQNEWVRAVQLVRRTARGWVVDARRPS